MCQSFMSSAGTNQEHVYRWLEYPAKFTLFYLRLRTGLFALPMAPLFELSGTAGTTAGLYWQPHPRIFCP